MSFWQGLVETYDANYDELEKEFPLSTTSISNNSNEIIVIKLDVDGNYLGYYKIEKRKNKEEVSDFVFPVTELSMGRSCGICAHPIFDQFGYLSGEGDKFEAYIKQLRDFEQSRYATSQIKAIFNYVSGKSILSDLADIKIKGNKNILFEVETGGAGEAKVWENKETIRAWHNYYLSTKEQDESFDFITGKIQKLARAHPRKISNTSGNAKLISANDRSNFTYRGIFADSDEALSIGYESSQKAHQLLRFLIRDRGLSLGEQVIIAYEIGQDLNSMKLKNPLESGKNILEALRENISIEKKYSASRLNKKTPIIVLDEEKTGRSFVKYCKEKTAIIILDAATTGRLSVKYYQELDNEDYLEKLVDWHEAYKFNFSYFNKGNKYRNYIQSPSVDRISKAIYRKSKINNDEGHNEFKKIARERFIHCIFSGESIPRDYVDAVVRRASVPFSINGDNIREIIREHEEVVSIACALVRKSEKEVYGLSLERENKTRDYLFGRLLGAADKFECIANQRYKNKRATTSLMYMNAFSRRPFKIWLVIRERLVPYIQELKGKNDIAYSEIEEIENMFKISDFENDSPLNGIFLLGYSCEKKWIAEEVMKVSSEKTCKEEVILESTKLEVSNQEVTKRKLTKKHTCIVEEDLEYLVKMYG
ncbi:MAG: type I-C CRISPR-associated protein Cas8c/Csd1 [Clostridioides sp.]|jgi:CRISPR-associated protein Csd1|nr:type I-C CRISPR-associated protein Cas8c/Csd1 [Clostridioides sp.]